MNQTGTQEKFLKMSDGQQGLSYHLVLHEEEWLERCVKLDPAHRPRGHFEVTLRGIVPAHLQLALGGAPLLNEGQYGYTWLIIWLNELELD